MTHVLARISIALMVTIFWACASDPSPPEYYQIDIPDDTAAKVLGDYLAFLPSDWERGTITISSCKGSVRARYCDFYVEHRMRKCEFGAYLIFFAGDSYNMPHYKTVPDERAKACVQ